MTALLSGVPAAETAECDARIRPNDSGSIFE